MVTLFVSTMNRIYHKRGVLRCLKHMETESFAGGIYSSYSPAEVPIPVFEGVGLVPGVGPPSRQDMGCCQSWFRYGGCALGWGRERGWAQSVCCSLKEKLESGTAMGPHLSKFAIQSTTL